jgi:hypothetical protein
MSMSQLSRAQPPAGNDTALLHIICAMLPSQSKDIYIDIESTFCQERIESIAKARGLDPAKILQNIQIARPVDSAQR